MGKSKVLVIGDSSIDKFHYGHVTICDEEFTAPSFKGDTEETVLGMASLVAEALDKFGVGVSPKLGAPTKITRHRVHGSATSLLDITETLDCTRYTITIHPEIDLEKQYDAIVLVDYGFGSVTKRLVEDINARFSKPVYVITRQHDLTMYGGWQVIMHPSKANHAYGYIRPIITIDGREMKVCQDLDEVTTSLAKLDPHIDPYGSLEIAAAGLISSLVRGYSMQDSMEYAAQVVTAASFEAPGIIPEKEKIIRHKVLTSYVS